MVKYIQAGDAIDYTPTEDVAAGSIVILSRLIGIAVRDLPANVRGALAIAGVFEFDKEEGAVFAVGDLAYLITATGHVTDGAGEGIVHLGKAFVAAAVEDEKVRVRLCSDEEHIGD